MRESESILAENDVEDRLRRREDKPDGGVGGAVSRVVVPGKRLEIGIEHPRHGIAVIRPHPNIHNVVFYSREAEGAIPGRVEISDERTLAVEQRADNLHPARKDIERGLAEILVLSVERRI